jgi:hypothetical protein
MQEYLIGFLVLCNTALAGFCINALYKHFPKISHSQVHRAATKQHMELSAAAQDTTMSGMLAAQAGAEAEQMEKPFGVTNDMWQTAIQFAQEEGVTIDDALLALQSDESDRGLGPLGVSG